MTEDTSISQYTTTLFGGEDPLLEQMRQDAIAEGLPPIQVSVELGRLLQLTTMMLGARRVLEIGALFGYSSILIARALPEDGKIITLELEPKHVEVTTRNLERAGMANKVQVRQGNALDALQTLQGESFDLVFIDADKESYPQYLDWALRLTRAGSVIIADNVWRGGGVVHPDDQATRALADFNNRLASNPKLFSTIVAHKDCQDAASISYVRQ